MISANLSTRGRSISITTLFRVCRRWTRMSSRTSSVNLEDQGLRELVMCLGIVSCLVSMRSSKGTMQDSWPATSCRMLQGSQRFQRSHHLELLIILQKIIQNLKVWWEIMKTYLKWHQDLKRPLDFSSTSRTRNRGSKTTSLFRKTSSIKSFKKRGSNKGSERLRK